MKSRFTIAMITVGGLLGLVLVALLANGWHEGIANAQRANVAVADSTAILASEDPASVVPANTAPAYRATNRFQPIEATRAGTTPGSRTNVYGISSSQPLSGLSVSSSQPIVVAIKEGPQLSGDTVNLNAFEFKTIFGSVSIPVDTIMGLRLADEPRQPATICLSNGDSLTGELVTDSVSIRTAWGGATIARDQIVSIVTTTEPVTWQQHEGRWKLVVAKPPIGEAKAKDVDELNNASDAADQPPAIEY